MSITLAEFQKKAIGQLLASMQSGPRDVVLKSPTGSGKTIILTHFMAEYLTQNAGEVFVWLTPGKGNLEEQSKRKMDLYIHGAQTKLLDDVMAEGFRANDCCFINWEKLTKKGNNALKEGERASFLELVAKAREAGLSFKVVIDESHQNFTEKSDSVVQIFKTNKIVRCSATPIVDKRAKLIEVAEEDVIAEGLIKKLLVINENFPQVIETQNEVRFLLEKALAKQRELRAAFLARNKDITPLIIVQLPNNDDAMAEKVEEFFEGESISYGNGLLAVWLSARHENLEGISENSGKQIAVIIKQAIATGWDCPRAHILVKLRKNMEETFEVQTIGRIRRMPEAKHYGHEGLDSCYLYTCDGKFTQGVRTSLGKSALDAKTLFLKNDFRNVTLVKEQRTAVTDLRDPRRTLSIIAQALKGKYALTTSRDQNRVRLEVAGYVFSDGIVRSTVSGEVSVLGQLSEDGLNEIKLMEPINTHAHGREFHREVFRIGQELGMKYEHMVLILNRLFGEVKYSDKILGLTTRELYAFVINNAERLRRDFVSALSVQLAQGVIAPDAVSEKPFTIPRSILFTYDASAKSQRAGTKNVYEGYLLSAEPRSSSEKKFERFCEDCKNVDWVYKNGDKGEAYFSIVYTDNASGQKLFFPDYILSVKGRIWVAETKGGFNKRGESEDIDAFSPKKFEVLQAYLQKHGLQGGFVRYDKGSEELYICTQNYTDDISSEDWRPLDEVFAEN